MGRGARAGIAVGVVVLLAGGYVAADAYDVVPGVLTTQDPYPEAAPFPVAPGAVAAPPLAEPLPAVGDQAPLPSAASIQHAVDALVKDTRLGPQVGVVVTDLATGTVLGEHAPDTPRAPASTQKILTAAAALASPGPEKTLATQVVLTADDALVLVGGGDMMLAAGAGNPDAVNGRAGLEDLAAQVAGELKLTGRTTVPLFVDDTYFSGPAISPAWDPGDVPAGFAAPVAALAVDIARLGPDEYAQRSPDPSMAAAAVFAQRLAEQGVTVAGDVTRGVAPGEAKVLGQVESAPLADVVDYFLQHSDNSVTEAVGRVVAVDAGLPGSFEGATQAVRASVERLGVDLAGAVLLDCSGLGRGSTATPAQLTAVVGVLGDPGQPRLRSGAVGMPIAGLRGTLDERFLDNAGRGVVRAKTGSLPNISALSGTVVTADDRQLAFTLMADAVPAGGTVGARVIFDDFVGALADCGCTS